MFLVYLAYVYFFINLLSFVPFILDVRRSDAVSESVFNFR